MSDNNQSEKIGTKPLALPPGVESVADLGTVLTLKEAATRLGLSTKTVQRMLSRGDLPGAHKTPMPGGKGEQWAIPVSAVEGYQAAERKSAPAPDTTAAELEALRTQVEELRTRADLYEALASERAHQLEQLHLTVRLALNAGTQPRRRWWNKKADTQTP